MKTAFAKGFMFFIMLLSLVFISCDNDKSTSDFNPDDFNGTWEGIILGKNVTIAIMSLGWIITVPGDGGFTDVGTVTMMEDNKTGILYSTNLQKNTGIISIININAMNVILNENAAFPGTYTFTRRN